MERGFRTDNLSTWERQHLLRADVGLVPDVPEGQDSDLEVAKRVLSGSLGTEGIAIKERSSSKILALAEVVLVYVILKTLVKAYYAIPLSGREFDVLHWPYSVQLLSLGVAVAMIAAFGRRWRAYGLVPNWRENLRLGGGLALLFIAVPMVVMVVFGGPVRRWALHHRAALRPKPQPVRL